MPNYKRVFESNRFVFITINVFKRKHILIDNIDLLRNAFKNSKQFYNYKIIAIVVLPDHIHMVINPENIKDYPKIISRIKHYFSRNSKYKAENLSQSKILKRERGIWQRRYWEHTIRDENDLHRHLDYIHYNPVKHGYVNMVRIWKYSSFHQFVKNDTYEINWGNNEDIKNMINLDFE